MKALILAVFATLMLLPIATAQPSGAETDKETDTIRQGIGDGVHVTELLDFHITDTAAYNANATWTFLVQNNATGLKAFAGQNGQEQTVNSSKVASSNSGSGIAFYNTVSVNLTGLFTVTTSDKLTVRIEFSLPTLYDHQLSHSPAALIVYAEANDGFEPRGKNIPDFFPTGERYHAAMTNPPAGLRYSVDFVPASPDDNVVAQGTRDLTPYFWAAAGLVAGFLIALYLARRGLFGTASKKFKKGGTLESGAMLEARRRTLMAALKELEIAHDAKEIPDSAYAPLKEEYKAQAVRVMRTLDEKQDTSPKT